MRKVWKICRLNFRKWPSSPRLFVVAALVLVFTNTVTSPISDLAQRLHERVSPWLMPFVLSDDYMILLLLGCVVILFCDAPFLDEQQPYLVVRSGKTAWAAGQILFLLLASLVFSLFVFAAINLNLIGRLGLTADWGKLIGTLAQADAGVAFDSPVSFDYRILVDYSAVGATLLVVALLWAVCAFLGLLICLLNLHLHNSVGPVVAFALVLAEYLLPILRVDVLFFLSPASWVNLNYIDPKGVSFFPGPVYCFAALCLGCAGLIIGILLSCKRKEIQTQI